MKIISLFDILIGIAIGAISVVITFVCLYVAVDIGYYYSPKTYDCNVYRDGKWHTLRIYEDNRGEFGVKTQPNNPDLMSSIIMSRDGSYMNPLNVIYDIRTDSVFISSNVKDEASHVSGKYRYIEQTDSAFISRLTPDRDEYLYRRVYCTFSGLEISSSDRFWWFEVVKPATADSTETVEGSMS